MMKSCFLAQTSGLSDADEEEMDSVLHHHTCFYLQSSWREESQWREVGGQISWTDGWSVSFCQLLVVAAVFGILILRKDKNS